MYAGKRNTDDDGSSSFDHKTGAAAVVRNLRIVLAENERHQWHAVVVDRYYSSILLAVELLKMNVYVVGTVMVNRLGLDKNLKVKSATRPPNIPRGTFMFSRSVAIPSMVAFHWWDWKPVHYLCTGAVMTASTIQRKVKQIGAISVPCPTAVNGYQGWMGGVDVHDQLRLQAYSLQTSTKFKKYYKSLFLGFVDLFLVNAYISHTDTAKIAGTAPMSRREWFRVLQNQLLQLNAEDFSGVVAPPPPNTTKRMTRCYFRFSSDRSPLRYVVIGRNMVSGRGELGTRLHPYDICGRLWKNLRLTAKGPNRPEVCLRVCTTLSDRTHSVWSPDFSRR